ncbi:MAG: hypothetical protein QM730_19455 [Anaerolineales bacterium]
MKRKSNFVFGITLLALVVAACSPATPTSPSPIESGPILSTPTATTAVTVSSTVTGMDPSLACAGGKTSASPTVELTEGPYYKSGSPEQANVYQDGMTGTKLVVSGYVYDTNCQPVANAWLDFWQADANGVYDNNGYTLRGHQYTDATGHFELTTVVPGIYPGRTEHIHVKVQAPNGQVITSQLFFPGVSQNDADGIYDSSLLLAIQETGNGLQGQFNFVVPAQ